MSVENATPAPARGEPLQLHATCVYLVGPVVQRFCDHTAVAMLCTPAGDKKGRCEVHAHTTERALNEARPLDGKKHEYDGYSLEWLAQA